MVIVIILNILGWSMVLEFGYMGNVIIRWMIVLCLEGEGLFVLKEVFS